MSTLVTRAGKGSPLTHNEVDANFNNLNTDKIQSGNTVAALTITALTTPSVQASGSGGLALKNSAGTTQISMGGGGGDNVTIAVATNINGANAQIDISPTGTGHVHIKPTGTGSLEIAPTNVGTINNMSIGATTASTGAFSTLSATGVTTVQAGSVSAPAITTTGDSNTGIYFPAADTIAFTEGGVEAARFDANGRLGIGTSSPTTPLQVNGTITAPLMADTLGGSIAPISSVMRNRIINGAMTFDQRNAGASVTPTATTYTLDRWNGTMSAASKYSVQQDAGAITPPVGFNNYLGVTSTSAYTVGATETFLMQQRIEGYNVADLGWGTANAKTVTLSFWVRSSLTGTFGGSLRNSDGSRSYPFSYTISAANTWEYETITIAGDTSGTWLTTNGIGLSLTFGLGVGADRSGTAGAWSGTNYASATGATSVVGTNGATWYVTGVQLEVGTQATGFEYRQYTTELQLCQRYYQKMSSTNRAMSNGYNLSTIAGRYTKPFIVTMRTAPTALETTGTATDYRILHAATATTCSAVPNFTGASTYEIEVTGNVASGLTAGQGSALAANTVTAYLAWSAEL